MEWSIPEPLRMSSIHGILDRSAGSFRSSSASACQMPSTMISWRAVSLLCNILDGELVGPHDLTDLLQSFGALGLDQLLVFALSLDASLGSFESFQSFVQLALNLNFNGDQSSSQLGLEGLRHFLSFQVLKLETTSHTEDPAVESGVEQLAGVGYSSEGDLTGCNITDQANLLSQGFIVLTGHFASFSI